MILNIYLPHLAWYKLKGNKAHDGQFDRRWRFQVVKHHWRF